MSDAGHAHTLSRRRANGFIHERHRLGSLHVARLQVFHSESRVLNEINDRPIKMASASNSFPDWRKAMLPTSHPLVRREIVFDEQQLSTGLKNSAHLRERCHNVGDAAQRPGRHDCIDAGAIEWN